METIIVNVTNPITPEVLVAELRAYRQRIPEYTQLTPVSSKILRSAAAANIHFVHASINAVGTSSYVQGALGTTDETLWKEADDSARWTAVEDELRALLQGVAAGNLTRRHRLGLTALQVYSISRQLVRKPEHSNLLPHVAEMRRHNRFGRKRNSDPSDTDPKPQPQPQPPPKA
jgi:hypothetical protein